MNITTFDGQPHPLLDSSGNPYRVCFDGYPYNYSWSSSFSISGNALITPIWSGNCVTFDITATFPGPDEFTFEMNWLCGGDGPQTVEYTAIAALGGLIESDYQPGSSGSFLPLYGPPCSPYSIASANPAKQTLPSWITINPATGEISRNAPAGATECYFVRVFCAGIDQAVVHLFPPTAFEALDGAALKALKKEMPWGRGQPINNEPQYYSFASDTGINPAFTTDLGHDPHIDNGSYLSLEMSLANPQHQANNRYSSACEQNPDGSYPQARYVSGVITTEGIYEQQEGRWQVDIKMPAGNGFWGGVWEGGNHVDTVWPPTSTVFLDEGMPPEYDFEWDGGKLTQVFPNVHHPKYDGVLSNAQGQPDGNDYSESWNTNDVTQNPPGGRRPGGYSWYNLPGGRTADQWNTYTKEIRNGQVTWWVNGICLDQAQAATAQSQDAKDLFVVINLAMMDMDNCNHSPGFITNKDGSTPIPAEMQVRNLRIWA